MSTSAIVVGYYLIARGLGRYVPFEIIKLVYLAHGYVLGMTGRPLIMDRIEAWKHGPIIPNLFHALAEYGRKPVLRLYTDETPVASPEINRRRDELAEMIGREDAHIINQVADAHSECGPLDLSGICHSEGSPWDQVVEKKYESKPIPNDVIMAYYKEKLER